MKTLMCFEHNKGNGVVGRRGRFGKTNIGEPSTITKHFAKSTNE